MHQLKSQTLRLALTASLLVFLVALIVTSYLLQVQAQNSVSTRGRNGSHSVSVLSQRNPTPNATTATSAATLSSSDTPMAVDIFNAQGNFDSVAYRRIASNMGKAEGIAYRYGPDYSAYHATAEQFPTYWHPADKHLDNHGNGPGWDYEVGGPYDASKNDYSANMGQALYTADDPGDHGVDSLIPLLMGDNTYSEKPLLPWQYYGGGHPEPHLLDKNWIQANGGPLTQPVALARSYGNGNWNSEDLIAFNNGFIGSAGSNTARNSVYLKLPPNKVPTSIAITNNSEFALVTVWDTQALKGQIAVIALGEGDGFWGDWKELYPGLRNDGNFLFMKLLGFVDLPDMVAPTAITAVTDYRVGGKRDRYQGWMVSPDGKNGRYTLRQLSLSNETNRQSFITGPNKDLYSEAGVAVVISKSEHKAMFLDLKPLFQKIQTMYFTSRSNFDKTSNVGQAPTQWPYAFSISPDFAPTVIKTVSFQHRPTAVSASLGDNVDRAYVATQDGTLAMYATGGYGDGSNATLSSIQAVGSVKVGNNPTCIAYAKNHGWGTADTLNNELIVLARGDRRIDWVKLSGTGGTIFRTLRDSRMQDPIWVEDNDNHGTESYLLTIADYAGKQVLNYRYGPVIYHTNGGATYSMGPDGKASFEFGGAYHTAGGAFQFSGANVP